MKGKTLGAISGLVAALGLVGCTETHNYVTEGAAQFLSNEGWKYVSETEEAYEVENEGENKAHACSSRFIGFLTQVKKLRGINPEGNVDTEYVCCILEQHTHYVFPTTAYDTHAAYCEFLKQ